MPVYIFFPSKPCIFTNGVCLQPFAQWFSVVSTLILVLTRCLLCSFELNSWLTKYYLQNTSLLLKYESYFPSTKFRNSPLFILNRLLATVVSFTYSFSSTFTIPRFLYLKTWKDDVPENLKEFIEILNNHCYPPSPNICTLFGPFVD